MAADALFAIQIGCAMMFGGSQTLQMLATTEGVSVTWFAFWEAFLGINLLLALRAHHARPSRVTRQTVVTYAVWASIVALNLGVLLWQSAGTWHRIDTVTSAVTASGIAITLLVARGHGLTVADPIVRSYFAVFFKAIPQLALAWHIYRVGGAGLAPFGVVAGHLTICTRLGQLWFSLGEAGWDRNRRGSIISELANEGSWIVATIAWLWVSR